MCSEYGGEGQQPDWQGSSNPTCSNHDLRDKMQSSRLVEYDHKVLIREMLREMLK